MPAAGFGCGATGAGQWNFRRGKRAGGAGPGAAASKEQSAAAAGDDVLAFWRLDCHHGQGSFGGLEPPWPVLTTDPGEPGVS